MSDNYKLAELEERIKSLEEFAEKFGLPENIRRIRRKPEPKVIIRKDGGTWLKRENGIDYLCMNPSDVVEEDDILNELSGIMKWKPINDKNGKQVLEINDDIAKLRPMVKCTCGCGKMFPLLAVADPDNNGNRFVGSDEGTYTAWVSVRLATVEDL